MLHSELKAVLEHSLACQHGWKTTELKPLLFRKSWLSVVINYGFVISCVRVIIDVWCWMVQGRSRTLRPWFHDTSIHPLCKDCQHSVPNSPRYQHKMKTTEISEVSIHANVSPRMVNPRDIAGNAEEEKEEARCLTHSILS